MSKKGQHKIIVNNTINITITQVPEQPTQETRKGLLERFTRHGWVITLASIGVLLEREKLLTLETLTTVADIVGRIF